MFNDNCKKAIQHRDKARLEVLKSNTEEKRRVLAQKLKERKCIVRKEKRTWKELNIKNIEYLNFHNFFGITNELMKKHKPRTVI